MTDNNDTKIGTDDDSEEEYITRAEAERLIDEKTRDMERALNDIRRALGEV